MHASLAHTYIRINILVYPYSGPRTSASSGLPARSRDPDLRALRPTPRTISRLRAYFSLVWLSFVIDFVALIRVNAERFPPRPSRSFRESLTRAPQGASLSLSLYRLRSIFPLFVARSCSLTTFLSPPRDCSSAFTFSSSARLALAVTLSFVRVLSSASLALAGREQNTRL